MWKKAVTTNRRASLSYLTPIPWRDLKINTMSLNVTCCEWGEQGTGMVHSQGLVWLRGRPVVFYTN